jgi:catechol 2,3-dioxygenase-like lactoylglutathione lyase family enzyme
MISGAHVVIYSTDAEADRAFLRDILGFSFVDAGQGWLIFALPPAEIAVHPAQENDKHEIYLMCDNIATVIEQLQGRNILCEPVTNAGWGLLTRLTLPGGGKLGLYEPRHPLAAARPADRAARNGSVEVVLRDFDGTRTIFPTQQPLKDIIHTAQTDLEITVPKIYVRTDQTDESGRVIYAETR